MAKQPTPRPRRPRKVPTLASAAGKLHVFISWSEARSRAVAEALHRWLPSALQNVVPFFSPEINKGADWIRVLRNQLEVSSAGIICLTPENLSREWLLFEAGALSKFTDSSLACPFLFDLKKGEVKPPFGSLQATDAADKEDVFKLVMTLNAALGGYGAQPEPLRATFEGVWPRLVADLSKIGPRPSETLKVEIPIEDRVAECLRAIQRVEASLATLTDRSRAHYLASMQWAPAGEEVEPAALHEYLSRAQREAERGTGQEASASALRARMIGALVRERFSEPKK